MRLFEVPAVRLGRVMGHLARLMQEQPAALRVWPGEPPTGPGGPQVRVNRNVQRVLQAFPDAPDFLTPQEWQRIASAPPELVDEAIREGNIGPITDIGSPAGEPPFPGLMGRIPGLRTPAELAATVGTAGLGSIPVAGKIGGLVAGSLGAFGGGELGERAGGTPGRIAGEITGGLAGGLVGAVAGPPIARVTSRAAGPAVSRFVSEEVGGGAFGRSLRVGDRVRHLATGAEGTVESVKRMRSGFVQATVRTDEGKVLRGAVSAGRDFERVAAQPEGVPTALRKVVAPAEEAAAPTPKVPTTLEEIRQRALSGLELAQERRLRPATMIGLHEDLARAGIPEEAILRGDYDELRRMLTTGLPAQAGVPAAARAGPRVTRPGPRTQAIRPAAETAQAETPTPLAGGGPHWQDAADRLAANLRRFSTLFEEQEKLVRRPELARRTGRALEELKKPGEAMERILASRAQLKGPLGRLPLEEFELRPEESAALLERIRNWGIQTGRPLDVQTAVRAIEKIGEGIRPAPHEIDLLERIFGGNLAEALREVSRSRGNRFWQNVADIILLPKAVKTMWDLSAALRQAIVPSIRHPKEFWGNIIPMARSYVSEDVARSIQESITRDPTMIEVRTARGKITASLGDLFQNMGIIRPLEGGSRLSREELFMMSRGRLGRLFRKIPGMRASERAFIVFTNKLRADLARKWLKSWHDMGIEATPERLAQLGDLLNALTGRAPFMRMRGLGPLRTVAQLTFWAPGYRLSKPWVLATMLNPTIDPAVRRIAAENLVTFVGAGLATLATLKATGFAEVEIDPRSTDFGKIKIGNTRINFWGADQVLARTIAQMITERRLDPELGLLPTKRARVFLRYLRSGLAPEWSMLWDIIEGQSFLGEQMFPSKERGVSLPEIAKREALNRLTPMALQDIMEAVKDDAVRGTLLAPAVILGLTVQTYGKSTIDRLQEIPQFRGGLTPRQIYELEQFYDTVEKARQEWLKEGLDVSVADAIRIVAEHQGKGRNFIAWATLLRPGSATRERLRNPEWIQFVKEHEDEIRERWPQLLGRRYVIEAPAGP